MRIVLLSLFLFFLYPLGATATEVDVVFLVDASDSTDSMRQIPIDPQSGFTVSLGRTELLRRSVAELVSAVPTEAADISLTVVPWGDFLGEAIVLDAPLGNQAAARHYAKMLLDAPRRYLDGTALTAAVRNYTEAAAGRCLVVVVATHDQASDVGDLGELLTALPLSTEVHLYLEFDDGYEDNLAAYRREFPLDSAHTAGKLHPGNAGAFLAASITRVSKDCLNLSS